MMKGSAGQAVHAANVALGLEETAGLEFTGLHPPWGTLMTVVVKIGGARAVDPEGALADVASLVEDGEDVVLTHGGSTAVDETLEELGEEPTYVETPGGVVGRFTDERTMDVFKMVMPGKLNTDLVESLHNEGVDAVGLSGTDGKLLCGKRKSAVRVKGRQRRRSSAATTRARSSRSTPTCSRRPSRAATRPSSPFRCSGRRRAQLYTAVNADADRAAAAIAGALEADLVVLTDVSGIYEDPDDESTKIESASTPDEFEAVKDAAEGFMTKKVMAAEEALEGGASSVIVATANADEPITSALAGEGRPSSPARSLLMRMQTRRHRRPQNERPRLHLREQADRHRARRRAVPLHCRRDGVRRRRREFRVHAAGSLPPRGRGSRPGPSRRANLR